MITYTERKEGEKLSKRIDAYIGKERVGSIVDSCCQTKVAINGTNPIQFLYETGMGGYLAKTTTYDNLFKEALQYIYDNKWLQDVLKVKTLRISRTQIAIWKSIIDSFNVKK